jgi:hypothetical protein
MRKSITQSKIKNFYLIILFFIPSIGFTQSQCSNSDFETGTLSGLGKLDYIQLSFNF